MTTKPLLLLAFIAAASAANSTSAADVTAKQLVGAWEIDAGIGLATYRFNEDGTFSLTFTSRGGSATGRWTLTGNRLVMNNLTSDSPFTLAGEQETAEVVSVTNEALRLKTTDIQNRPETLELFKVLPPPPFEAGKRDKPQIVGAFRASPDGRMLVLAADGTAVFGPAFDLTYLGRWSQTGNELVIRSAEFGRSIPEHLDPMQALPSGLRREGYATTRPSTTTRPTAATRLAGRNKQWIIMLTGAPVPIPPRNPGATTRPGFATTRPAVPERTMYTPRIAHMTFEIVQASNRSLTLRTRAASGEFVDEYIRVNLDPAVK